MISRVVPITRLVVALVFLMLLIPVAHLQAQEASRFDMFGGFSYMRFNALTIGYRNDTNLYGWNFDGTGYIKLSFGITADASGHYGSQLSSYHFLIGPQYTWRRDKSNIYVHGLFGKAQNNVSIAQPTRSGFESVGKSFGGGFGFDYHYSDRFSIRVFQVDFLHSDTFGKGQNDGRVSTGLIYHFGHIGHRRRL
ncbi:MAG: hypothetical protein JOZ80_04725 [Acidobacteriaceae bacterium]|nr:hypothetical protein [Acidobacteriaceae bacterium]